MEIQGLTVSERIMLAEALWDSLSDESADINLTDEQKAELERRLSAYKVDGDQGSDWASVKARIISKV